MRCLHFTLCVTALAATLATPLTATPAVADDQWTVLTMAPDGSWGAATASPIGRAIAFAIVNCKIDYQRDIGCGAICHQFRPAGASASDVAAKTSWWQKRPWATPSKRQSAARLSCGGFTCPTCRHAGAL